MADRVHPCSAGSAPLGREGAVLALVALMLVVFLGMSALAVDFGIFMSARTEAQRTADAAALSGAGAYLSTLDEDAARAAAIDFGQRNRIRGGLIEIRPEDVDVIADSQKVRVRVYQTRGRDSAVPTLFGRVLGFFEVDVSTVAAAQAFPAGAIDGACLLPFAIPDRWREADGSWPSIYDDFDPGADDYVPWSETDDPDVATGYQFPETVGFRIQIRGAQSLGADYHPGWWRHVWFWELPGNGVPGNNRVVNAIRDCVEEDVTPVHLDDWYQTQPGNLSGPQIAGAFNFVIDSDPSAYWDDGCDCVTRGGGEEVLSSPRIRPLAMFDPRQPPQNGAFPVQVTGFVNVFIESVDGGGGGPPQPGSPPGNPGQPDVWVRYMGVTGIAPGEWTEGPGTIPRILRLVQ